eukprot:12261300-Alexandrium_andersonii.AAC.1
MHDKWSRVFDGNGDLLQTAIDFTAKYAGFFTHLPEERVGPITPKAVLATFRSTSPSAPGADNWMPSELANMPFCAVAALARMCRQLEEGDQWPRQLLSARAIHLSKNVHMAMDPM